MMLENLKMSQEQQPSLKEDFLLFWLIQEQLQFIGCVRTAGKLV